MSLYDDIKAHFLLPDAHNDWRSYRNTLTEYLIAETDEVSLPLSFPLNEKADEMLPTLAIIGAGACNDLDLHRLCTHFSKITLIDCDEAALQTALTTYQLHNHSHIELIPASLTQITDSDYRTFCECLQSFLQFHQTAFSFDEFEEYALALLDKLYSNARRIRTSACLYPNSQNRQETTILAPASYDYVWCFGVHSQLQAMFSYIYHAFIVNLQNGLFPNIEFSENIFAKRLKEENNQLIPVLNDQILASAKKAVYIGCEQQCLSELPSSVCKRNPEDAINLTAVEGAYQSIQDIRKRNLNLTESVILWPFHPAGNVFYEMLIQKITF